MIKPSGGAASRDGNVYYLSCPVEIRTRGWKAVEDYYTRAFGGGEGEMVVGAGDVM